MHVTIATMVDKNEVYNLYGKSIEKSIYNHPEWYTSIIASGVHTGVFGYLEVYSDHNLIAIWPFVVRRGGVKDLFARIVEPLGTPYSDYIAPLIDESSLDVALDGLTEGLANFLENYGRMRLPKMIHGAAYAGVCGNGLVRHAFVSQQRIQHCPRLKFSASYELTEKGWGKSHRPVVRRKLRKLEREGDLMLWVASERQQIKCRLPVLFKLHRAKWKRQGEPSQFERAADRLFFRLLAERLPFKMLHYSEVRLDGKAISCHFGFIDNDWLYWYKPAYDPAYYKYSPGLLHIALLVRHGIERALTGIDFLQGDEDYKYRWANEMRDTVSWTLATKRGWQWWVWDVRYREKVKKLYLETRRCAMYLRRSRK